MTFFTLKPLFLLQPDRHLGIPLGSLEASHDILRHTPPCELPGSAAGNNMAVTQTALWPQG